MIDLNDAHAIRVRDPEDMLGHIAGLADQCEAAWRDAHQIDLPDSFRNVDRVVIAGMGGSAIGGALLQALAAPRGRLPIHVVRDYDLPAFAHGPSTLVVVSSYSGNTEETLASVEQVRDRQCQWMAVTSGGKIGDLAQQAGVPFLHVPYHSPPRAALGYAFVPLLAFASRLGWIDDQSAHLKEATSAMRAWSAELAPEVPAARNLAKRLAGQLMGRFVIVFGAGYFTEVARRWKSQINENGKHYAAFEALPEADHNALLGSSYPEDMPNRLKLIFLTGSRDHSRNKARAEITREILMTQGCDTDLIVARGESPLAQMLSLILLGDWVSGYLGVANGADPSDTALLEDFKTRMAGI